jgi:hypothetical protein
VRLNPAAAYLGFAASNNSNPTPSLAIHIVFIRQLKYTFEHTIISFLYSHAMDPGLRAPLCKVCKAMLACINDPSTWIASHDTGLNRTTEGPHQKSTKSLLVAAAWGCGICARLKERLSGSGFLVECSQPTDGHPWLRYDFIQSLGVNEASYLQFWDWSKTSYLGIFACERVETEQVMNQTDLRNLYSVNTGDEEVFERAVHGFQTAYHIIPHVRSMLSQITTHRGSSA